MFKRTTVPTSPAKRLLALGGLAAAGVGSVVVEGAKQLARGRKPDLGALIFSGSTGLQVAEHLARMRGAAMKVGQILSMDNGDLLPPEFSQALAQLQQAAHTMPNHQVDSVLRAGWGAGWRDAFHAFSPAPIAAASIGQVHKAVLKSGQVLAVKIQFPNVKTSIDADVANISGLLKAAGLANSLKGLDSLIEKARVQLHQETDYLREADFMESYRAELAGSPQYLVPAAYEPLTRPNILAMDFMEGEDLETVVNESQAMRDQTATRLFELCLKELFALGVMQTDPNFANYKWVRKTGQIVLLDFGATRPVPDQTVLAYRKLMQAGLNEDREAVRAALVDIGMMTEGVNLRYAGEIKTMMDVMIRHFGRATVDFADRTFVPVIKAQGSKIALDRSTWHVPPADTLFVQRKLTGTAMFGVKAKARIGLRGLVVEALRGNGS
ncbi:AarF/ABC1/UbiB kinase family protein [Asticcacaulis sp. AC402]|uniref:ABC1 kinase family protein n=1 Tax=Asticcacaulis sp. AC402 TaxID=1282361 RepID=UPI0003C40FD1|nr:AarF/ABC1/UbiB kinase family protein [Asticcacaulis sp. AC402]ESQ75285.1 ubiquinol-cytochrome C reductase [Asticcacaulis sp. AC402]